VPATLYFVLPMPRLGRGRLMRYVLRRKFWSLMDNFTIKDDNGSDVFRIVGQPFSWGSKLSFQTMAGEEEAFISQELWTIMPKYQIFKHGSMFAEVCQEFSWFNKTFTLDVPGPNDYIVEGSFWNQKYTFNRLGREVAHTYQQLALSDTYAVDIVADEDDVAILCTCVVIDLVCREEE
jgi:uncharacterized protein YxjI